LAVSHVYQGRAAPAAGQAGNSGPGWRVDVPESGGGLFVDLGSHVIDLLDFILGPLNDVAGSAAHRSSGSPPPPGVAEDTVVFSFSTQSGVLGTARYQFHTAGTADRLEFVGTSGTLGLSVFGQEPLELRRGDVQELIATPQPAHVHLPLVQSIVDELAGRGGRCPSTGHSALRASSVIDRVLAGYYGGRDDAFWERPGSWPGLQSAL
jgi:predicted dehydrogenase